MLKRPPSKICLIKGCERKCKENFFCEFHLGKTQRDKTLLERLRIMSSQNQKQFKKNNGK